MTIKGRFDQFTKNIRPTDEHIEEANRQTEWMIERLHDKVADDGTFTLEKVLRAGSNAKFTSLLRTDENVFDVDLGAYYSGKGATQDQLGTLLDFTRKKLIEIYHQKPEGDFTKLQSAVRVKFKTGIKLWVDVTPIIKDATLAITNGGHIPRDDGWRLTSVTAHNNFVTTQSAASKKVPGPVRFNRLVRLVKWWNNLQAPNVQPSIFCELIAAAAIRDAGVTAEWQTSLRQVFSFLRKHGLAEPIVFDDNYDSKKEKLATGVVVVLDSVNPQNNVTSTWTTQTRDGFLDRVEDAYDASTAAWSAERDGDEDEAVEQWCRIFGDKFRELSEEE
jgi:hypothetical protein